MKDTAWESWLDGKSYDCLYEEVPDKNVFMVRHVLTVNGVRAEFRNSRLECLLMIFWFDEFTVDGKKAQLVMAGDGSPDIIINGVRLRSGSRIESKHSMAGIHCVLTRAYFIVATALTAGLVNMFALNAFGKGIFPGFPLGGFLAGVLFAGLLWLFFKLIKLSEEIFRALAVLLLYMPIVLALVITGWIFVRNL